VGNEVTLVKLVDSASPTLFEKACQGETIDFALLTARKAGDKPLEFIKIKFEEVFIASVQPAGAPGRDDFPLESLTLNYGKITYDYTQQKEDGSPGPTTTAYCVGKAKSE
jgi:type VI secretion system secreted protein Hcp